MKEKRVYIYGDSRLLINQVNVTYQAKKIRLRSYRNIVLDLLENFKEYLLIVLSRNQNVNVDALAFSTSGFEIPIHLNKKYEIEVKHRPVVPNNVKYWQIFQDDQQFNIFLTRLEEFENVVIDEMNIFKKWENV